MANADTWVDFQQVRHNIKNNTVDRLKQILSGLNEECGMGLPKSGKKQEIIDRIVHALDLWYSSRAEDKWNRAKAVVYQVRNSGTYTPSRVQNTTVVASPVQSHGGYANGIVKTSNYIPSLSSTSSVGRYDQYAPPRRPQLPSTSSKPQEILFKESPFFQIDQPVSTVVECPESSSASDRRQSLLTFSLNNDHLTKLKGSPPYQLRLFCTSSIFYSPNSTFRTSNIPCPIEFPPTCEVRVNNTQLSANLKGLKKKPGTAPPPDIGKYVRLVGMPNRVEMVYVNSQQPVQSKKYYMVIMLVKTTAVDDLVAKLKAENYKSSQDIRQKMIDSMTEDDDIVAGPQKMSLKCPLSFMRVSTPCRSSKCVHPQCFDALSWYTMMEQTTTWLCPVCERVLDCKDLIIDGYFDEILQSTPDSIEDVIVEANGEWHTSENKYASVNWKATHPLIQPSLLPRKPPPVIQPSSPPKTINSQEGNNGKGKAQEIFVLDSDDEDEGRVKRELSPSHGSSANHSFESMVLPVPQTQTQVVSQSTDVIDLTLDSDSDEPLATAQNGKRKASEAELITTSSSEQIWKKGRHDPEPSSSRIHPLPSGTHNNGVDHSRHPANGHVALHHTPAYTSNFQGNTLPPVYPPNFPNAIKLPPLAGDLNLPRPHNTRWP